MALGRDYHGQDCGMGRALEVVGERWTLLIVQNAMFGVRRFNDFLTRLDIPKAVLAERLKHLVDYGVMEKRNYQGSPPRYEYELTERGRELWLPVYILTGWGQRITDKEAPRTFHHAECGAQLDEAGACPNCGSVPIEKVEMRPGPGPKRTDPVSRAMNRPRRLLEPIVREQ
ncbi:winged helix-turn-helix transcriptional regulator [Glycomyces arizonensis]|uniref:winged helix-turn-helix transcriptional regulator n=1 Tax=Glycomyces arizonensis TaxID=256035 RepID=UPI00041E42AC|nr:helix-turn-helix domain-containing protein [Glycomyces arizonensis]